MKKKILADILTLVMVLTMVPTVALASEPSSVISAQPNIVTVIVGDVQNIVVEIDSPAIGTNTYCCKQLNSATVVEVSENTYFADGQNSVTIPVKGLSVGEQTLAFKLYKNGVVVDGGSTVFVNMTVVNKTTPTTGDFTFTAPSNLIYDGTAKAATVTTAKEGMGAITLWYADSLTSDTWTTSAPVSLGTWYVKACIAEGTSYSAKDLTDENWKFTISKEVTKVDTTASVVKTAAKTGDSSNAMLYLIILILSVGVATFATKKIK